MNPPPKIIGAVLASLIVLLCLPLIARADSSEYAIIANPQINIKQVSLSTARTIFGMRLQYWNNKLPVRVYVLADNQPAHIKFSKEVLGMFPYQLRWAWDRLVFSGTGQAPIQVASEEEMLARIAATPGAIGYIKRSLINDHVIEISIN
ncbi:MAG: hypothetical protein HY940_08500 [Gammaproteobacteria bacterium]|nr:hypothetical protein [Gammaproteobacteria bacterium]